MGKRRTATPVSYATPQSLYEQNKRLAEIKACGSKATYYFKEDADAAALRARAVHGEKSVYPYSCHYCQNWHIGHQY